MSAFFRERTEFYLRDVHGYAYDVVKAVLTADGDDVVDALARAEAVKKVQHMPEFLAIAAACKRMRNILRQAEDKGIRPASRFEYLPEAAPEEKNLMAYLEQIGPNVEAHRGKKDAALPGGRYRRPQSARWHAHRRIRLLQSQVERTQAR